MKAHANILRIGDAVFDPSTRRLCCRGGERRLSLKAAGVLIALLETPERVWTREALLDRVWPNVVVGEEVLTHAVAEIRSAVGDDFRRPTVIETVHKTGYRLLIGGSEEEQGKVNSELLEQGASGFDLDAYGDYLQACALFDRGGVRNWQAARDLFEASLRKDAKFAPAYAGIAKAMLFLDQYSSAQTGVLASVLQHCHAAQRLDPQLGEAFAVEAMAHAVLGSDARALKLFGRAVSLAPTSHDVHELLGRACFAHLDPRLAPVMFARAAALRSEDFQSANLAGTSSMMIGNRDQAAVYFAMALPRVDSWLEGHPSDFKALSIRAHCLLHLGRDEEASLALEPVCSHPEPVRHSPACVLALVGELDRAIDVLEKSMNEGWHYRAWLARDPCLRNLYTIPRFKRLARAIDAR